jgi:drug/metabolite transporter (DMT)-like permease
LSGLLLALAASVVWGTSDFVGGLTSRGRAAVTVMALSQVIGLAGLSVVLLIAGRAWPGAAIVPWAVMAGFGTGLGVLCLYQALSIGPMSIVAPLTALAAIVPVGVGIAGGDRPSWLQGVGMAAAVAGCFLAARSSADGSMAVRRSGIVFALLAAALIGVGIVGIDRASDHDVLWGLEIARGVAVVLIGMLALALRGPRRMRAEARPVAPLVLIGTFDVTANGLFGWASTLGLLSVVSVLGSVYPVMTVLLARIVLGERMTPTQGAGVVAAFGGIALLVGG